MLSESPAKSPKREHGRGQEHRIFERSERRDFRRARQTSPVIDEALHAEPGESWVARSNEIHGLALSDGNVSQLAQLLITAQLNYVLRRMQPLHPHSIRQRSIAQAKLRAEIGSNEDQLSEGLVISHQPGSDGRCKEQRCESHSSN